MGIKKAQRRRSNIQNLVLCKMIKKLKHKQQQQQEYLKHMQDLKNLATESTLVQFIESSCDLYSSFTIEFYRIIGGILHAIGFQNVSVNREGDTNNRIDAVIIDNRRSIPIEIKSPRETEYINIKSVRQALENKIILLSRRFYPSEKDVTSLVVGFSYPNDRSGVFELIDDIWRAYSINIGAIDFKDLLKLYYGKVILEEQLDLELIIHLNGKYND